MGTGSVDYWEGGVAVWTQIKTGGQFGRPQEHTQTTSLLSHSNKHGLDFASVSAVWVNLKILVQRLRRTGWDRLLAVFHFAGLVQGCAFEEPGIGFSDVGGNGLVTGRRRIRIFTGVKFHSAKVVVGNSGVGIDLRGFFESDYGLIRFFQA